MKEAILFNGVNALDFQEIRDNVVRIPEVSARVREAQEIWDALTESKFSLYNFLLSENAVYLSNIKIKNLMTSIVQVGLFDRYLRKQGEPKFIVGITNGDSPLKVCIGEQTFEDMILSSQAARPNLTIVNQNFQEGMTLLSGVSIAEMGVYKMEKDGNYERVQLPTMELNKLMSYLIEELGVNKIINIGPGSFAIESCREDLALRDVQIVESIEFDPMLSWFWKAAQSHETPLSHA